jgi:AraC-like DNA-binding protein
VQIARTSVINLMDAPSVLSWCRELGCSEEELRRAVEAVGPEAIRVRAAVMFAQNRASRNRTLDTASVLSALGRKKAQV